ncbi:MAG: cadherin domain-containing protein [Marinifilaceae bacterium]|jgi:hypothetical protein|nr:cadherin domain-containing protein [Marinifilaceae bacterium]
MKKKIILNYCFLLLCSAICYGQDSNGDGYHDGDVAGLNLILSSNPSNTLNWTGTDYGSWSGVTWSTSNPKRVDQLNLNSKNLSSIDLSAFISLTKLVCNDNSISAIDISNNLALTRLFCDNNQITYLNISANTNLHDLYCNNNSIESIDVSSSLQLDLLDCRNNHLPFSQIYKLTAISIENRFPQKNIFEEKTSYVNQETDYSSEETIDGTNTVFEWYKDGTIIPGANSSKYTPTSIGVYHCVMTNTYFSGQSLSTNNITIQVNDHAPVITTTNLSIAENSANETTVGTVVFSDTDPITNPVSFSITDPTSSFTIDETTGVISVLNNTSLDKETTSSISVDVTIDDSKFSDTKSIAIGITNVNETPTDIQLSNSSVTENISLNTTIASLSTSDVDNGDSFTYSFATGGIDNSSFAISSNELKTNSSIDFETKNSYSIKIKTEDSGGLSYEKSFTISVNGVNEAPSNIQISNNTIQENQAISTTIGSLSSTDQDAGDGVTYTLTASGTDNSSFQISGSDLKSASIFDYETKKTYSIEIKAEDNGGLSTTSTFSVTVSNKNEQPTSINLSSNEIDENKNIGSLIGNLSTTDVDQTDTYSYSLASGGVDNSLFTISNNQLLTNSLFDYETKNQYSIKIKSTDNGGLYTESSFQVDVNDINDNPSDLNLSNNDIAEDASLDTEIGILSATDDDTGESFTYSVSGTNTDNSFFKISDNKLLLAKTLDYEIKNSYTIKIKVTDSNNGYMEKNFTINITNRNEAPTDISLSNVKIYKHQSSDFELAIITATDPDDGEVFSFEIADNTHFKITDNKLILKSGFENISYKEFKISITVSDSKSLKYTKDFTITIQDTPLNIDHKTKSIVNIYPNPVSSNMIVKSDKPILSIDVTDINGKTIHKIKKVNSKSYTLNFTELKSGIYIINIKTSTETISKKFIKS